VKIIVEVIGINNTNAVKRAEKQPSIILANNQEFLVLFSHE